MGGSLRSSLSKLTGRVQVKTTDETPASKTGSLLSTPQPAAQSAPAAPAPDSLPPAEAKPVPPQPAPQSAIAQQRVDPSPTPARSQPAPTTQGGNKLAHDVIIDGKLKFTERLIFDGRLKGEIVSSGSLSLQGQSLVEATITVKTILIEGKVVGEITATESARLAPSAVVIGNITTPSLTVDPGATFQCRAIIGKPTLEIK